MFLGDTVNVMAVVEREISQIQLALVAELLRPLAQGACAAEHAVGEIQRELVVAGGYRRVGGEHALPADGVDVFLGNDRIPEPRGVLGQQLQHQQARVPLIHVVAADLGVAQGAQHPDPADAQYRFLAQAVMLAAAIEVVGQAAIIVGVALQIGIQQIHRHDMAADALDIVLPTPHRDRAAVDVERHARRHLLEIVIHRPDDRFFGLPAARIDALMKVALAREQRDGDHRHAHVRRRAQGIPGQDPQTPGIRWDVGFQPDLHGEIRHTYVRIHTLSFLWGVLQ